jgi:hypothetical protein
MVVGLSREREFGYEYFAKPSSFRRGLFAARTAIRPIVETRSAWWLAGRHTMGSLLEGLKSGFFPEPLEKSRLFHHYLSLGFNAFSI